jgi:hypothetical protein
MTNIIHRAIIPVGVEFESGNDDIAGVDANGGRGSVRLVTSDTVDVNHPLLAVDLGDLAFPTLVLAAHDPDLIIFADGNGTNLYRQLSSEQ